MNERPLLSLGGAWNRLHRVGATEWRVPQPQSLLQQRDGGEAAAAAAVEKRAPAALLPAETPGSCLFWYVGGQISPFIGGGRTGFCVLRPVVPPGSKICGPESTMLLQWGHHGATRQTCHMLQTRPPALGITATRVYNGCCSNSSHKHQDGTQPLQQAAHLDMLPANATNCMTTNWA
jgi:hypothetical protein